jgi:hypothetical protein
MAPPPPPSVVSPVELPSAKVRFWTVSRGWSWSWQCEVVCTWAASHVFMYRMRRWPPPLRVTLPPPSSTISGPVSLRTLAVAVSVMVTGFGPQLKVMIPPAATASTTAADVQPAGEPSPMTRSGWDVSTARASAGTPAPPPGLPAGSDGLAGRLVCTARLRSGGKVGGGSVGGGGAVVGNSAAGALVLVGPAAPRLSSCDDPQATTASVATPTRIARAPQRRCMGRHRSRHAALRRFMGPVAPSGPDVCSVC